MSCRASQFAWASCALTLLSCRVGFASVCDAVLSDQATLFDATLQVSPAGHVERRVSLRGGEDVVVLAIESGTDVTMTITGDGVTRESDSPLPRIGVQRAMLRPRRTQEYSIRIASKKDESVAGAVRLRVVSVTAGLEANTCRIVHGLLSEADGLYANGQQVPRVGAGAAIDSRAMFLRSAKAYEEALRKLEGSGAILLAAHLQLALSQLAYWNLEDWPKAESWAARAVRGYSSGRDAYGLALARQAQAAALIEMRTVDAGNYRKAEALLRDAIASHAQRGENYDLAVAVNYLGVLQYYNAEYAAASQSYERALLLYRGVGDRAKQALVAGNLALLEYELGNLSKANQQFAQLQPLLDPARNPFVYAIVLNNYALSLVASGSSDKALGLYQAALSVARTNRFEHAEALSLQGLGTAYRKLGDQDQAEAFFQRALTIQTPELDAKGRMETLWALGNLHRESGRPGEALRFDQEALKLPVRPLAKIRMRLQVARDYEALGEALKAIEELESILAQRTPGDEYLRGLALLSHGRLKSNAEELRVALAISRKYEESATEFEALLAIAVVMRDRGNGAAAHREVDLALAVAERVRLQSANPALRAMQLQTTRRAFDLKIELLGAAYSVASSEEKSKLAWQALNVAERARARSLQDYTHLNLQQDRITQSALPRRRELYVRLADYRQRYEMDLGRYSVDDKVLVSMRLKMAEIRQQIDAIDAQAATSRTSSTAGMPLLVSTIAVPGDVGVVEYWLGGEQAYVWVLTKGSLTMTSLGSTSAIQVAAQDVQESLRDYLSTPTSVRLANLTRLADLVLMPVQAKVQAKRKLIFVPDMMLHYVPFAALPAGLPGRFLVQDRDVATAPSLSLLMQGSGEMHATKERMLLIADPVYGVSDSRLPARSRESAIDGSILGSVTQKELARLPGTAREIEAIGRMYPAGQVDRLQGLQATKAGFLGSRLERYRYIHVASHAVSDAWYPELSALLLTSMDVQGRRLDGRVLAADLLEQKLNAELVMLSACDTALGRVVGGEGMLGLRYVLLARGARSVGASLWPVGDRIALEMMSSFYQALLRDQASPLDAMGVAMREMISRGRRDPALWAAFDLTIRDARSIH